MGIKSLVNGTLVAAVAAIGGNTACVPRGDNQTGSRNPTGADTDKRTDGDSNGVQTSTSRTQGTGPSASGTNTGAASGTATNATATASPTSSPVQVGHDQVIAAFSKAAVYFASDQDNRRRVSAKVRFPPPSESYRAITAKVVLACPAGGCDPWDRVGSLTVDAGSSRKVEVLRFVTPYGTGVHWQADVTDLRPMLAGEQSLEVFIDTWVGPRSSGGAGWTVDVSFDFAAGHPPREVLAILPVFGPDWIDYGDPGKASLRSTNVTSGSETQQAIAKSGHSGLLRTIITGHGQGNTDGCAEFCAKKHTIALTGADMGTATTGSGRSTISIWRDNCGQTATDGVQRGTYSGSRAGWCPGATVIPWSAPLNKLSLPTTWTYEPENYVNGQRTGYDSGGHTPPSYFLSSALVIYRD